MGNLFFDEPHVKRGGAKLPEHLLAVLRSGARLWVLDKPNRLTNPDWKGVVVEKDPERLRFCDLNESGWICIHHPRYPHFSDRHRFVHRTNCFTEILLADVAGEVGPSTAIPIAAAPSDHSTARPG